MVYQCDVTDVSAAPAIPTDKWVKKFLAHLATDRGASAYTQRNYRQALAEFLPLASGRAATGAGMGNPATR